MASTDDAPKPPTRPLTLKLKTSTSFLNKNANSITAASPVATPLAISPGATPLATPTTTKIRLKVSQPPTPAAGVPILPAINASEMPAPASVTTKKGRVSKPTAKKRAKDDTDDDAPLSSQPVTKRLKLVKKPPTTLSAKNRTASIVVRQSHQAHLPPRSKGEGYDSEDDEKEVDPIIEEQFILRMAPGEHCDYLRKMTDERKIGVPIKDGGADFQLKWVPGIERRAMLTVKGTHFAGVLVDLPTITEGMKTWDRKNFMKSADICQMLLVFTTVKNEEEAKTAPLPTMVSKDFRWPHGLTPPMHDCIHRRFRKRLSKKEIKDKEAELQRLLTEDKLALETSWELVDEGRARLNQDFGDYEEMDENDDSADAFGEIDDSGYFGPPNGAAPDIDDEELEAEFFEDDDDDETAGGGIAETPATQADATPVTARNGTPAAQSVASAEVSDADDDDDDDLDDDEQAQVDQVKGVREDIEDLKKQLQNLHTQRESTLNALLRKRMDENIKKIQTELRIKQTSIGESEE